MSNDVPNGDKMVNRLRDACAALSSEFDSVHIFASKHRPEQGGTASVNYGIGNYFSRYGQVRVWIVREEEVQRVDETGEEAE